MRMITDPAEYFTKGCGRCARFDTPECSALLWSPVLAALRALCLDAGLSEDIRWGIPAYRHTGRNLALIGAFRDNAMLTFPDAALLDDREGLLKPAGPTSQGNSTIRFTALDQVTARAPAIRALLAAARQAAAEGRVPPRLPTIVELPEDLSAALDADPALAEAFAALTPGRQRSFVVVLSTARTQATRDRRIEAFRPRILAGKGATEA